MAAQRAARLIRLQCYEGLDASHAIYEWNYQRQLLAIRASEAQGGTSEAQLFTDDYLLKRPLLEAISEEEPPVLLIDEIDRADEEFEAYLLEILSDFQITIPELGTIKARSRPIVILTANGTRDLSDALRRRCLYSFLDYPSRETEMAILNARMPAVEGATGAPDRWRCAGIAQRRFGKDPRHRRDAGLGGRPFGAWVSTTWPIPGRGSGDPWFAF